MQIVNNTRQLDIISIVGMPVVVNSTLMNCAVVFQKGKILGIVPKTYLPNYKEFYEKRWFTSAVAHRFHECTLVWSGGADGYKPAVRYAGCMLRNRVV